MSSAIHKTIPVAVIIEVDEEIAPHVAWLGAIPGVRTHASCKGTIGEGGPEPHRPYVEVTWTNAAARKAIERNYYLFPLGGGKNWGRAVPIAADTGAAK